MIDHSSEPLELCKILVDLNFDGQRTLVTPESFSKPNIHLVCKILDWFSDILRLSHAKSGRQETGSNGLGEVVHPTFKQSQGQSWRATDYVDFLVRIGRSCYETLGIKLNLVALCKADKSCCPELLKVASPIYKAAQLTVDEAEKLSSSAEKNGWFERESVLERENCRALLANLSLDQNIDEISLRCRQLSEEIKSSLENEITHHEERLKVIEKRFELSDVERELRGSLGGIEQETERLKRTNAELKQDILHLDGKLASKEAEISDTKRRLGELLVKKPAYNNQYEALEKRYETAYNRYVSCYRNLAYLKSCICKNMADSATSDRDSVRKTNKELDDDDDEYLIDDDEGLYQEWLDEHRIGGPSSKPATARQDANAGNLLVVFDANNDRDIGSVRLLESLLNDGASSNLISTPLTTSDDKVYGVVDKQADRWKVSLADDRQVAARLNDLDPGVELEGLLDEFANEGSTRSMIADIDEAGVNDEDEEDEEEEEEEEIEGVDEDDDNGNEDGDFNG